MRRRRTLLVSLLLVSSAITAARGDELVLLDRQGRLRQLDPESGFLGEPQTVRGVGDDPRLLAIATHPATGVLYGLERNVLCTVDVSTGWLTQLGTDLDAVGYFGRVSGTSLDIDPAANEIRALVLAWSGTPKILRFDAATGALIGPDLSGLPELEYAGDEGHSPSVGASIAHRADGTVFGVDPRRGLFSIAPPVQDGVLTAIAPLSGLFDTQTHVSMEIVPNGTAYVVQVEHAASPDFLIAAYRLDLATGVATPLSRTASAPEFSVTDVTTAPFAPAVTIRTLDIRKAKVSFDFTRPMRDAFEIRGTLPESLEGWEGKTVRVCIRPRAQGTAQYNREFVLDRRGRGRTGRDSFRAAARAKAGAVAFVLRLSRTRLDQFDIDSQTSSRSIHSAVDALVGGRPFRADLFLRYARGKGAHPRRGVARRIP